MRLGILAIFKNESLNLREWIEHYLWQGTDHIWLIDNGSTDHPRPILQRYIEDDLVTYIHRPQPYAQLQHYREVYPQIRQTCDWCVIADLDEFWYCPDGVSLKHHLEREGFDVIASDWVMFGSSGLVEHPESIRSGLVHRWEDTQETQQKYAFRTHRVTADQIEIHYCLLRGRMSYKKDNATYVVNHYAIQSLSFFTSVKMTRGDVFSENNPRNLGYFRAYDRHAVVKDTRLKDLMGHELL